MKKLIIAAAIVCAAVVSQAASASWSMENDGASTYKYNSVLMLLDSSTATVQGILDAGGSDVLASLGTYNINSAGVQQLTKKGAATGTADDVVSGQSYRWLIIRSTDGTAADGTDYILSGAVSYATMDAAGAIVSGAEIATPFALVNGTTDLFKAGGAITGTIGAPEPTSGLLLLLGVAGLALKRKRA